MIFHTRKYIAASKSMFILHNCCYCHHLLCFLLDYLLRFKMIIASKQTGFEMCQAQEKLGLDKPALPNKKLPRAT